MKQVYHKFNVIEDYHPHICALLTVHEVAAHSELRIVCMRIAHRGEKPCLKAVKGLTLS